MCLGMLWTKTGPEWWRNIWMTLAGGLGTRTKDPETFPWLTNGWLVKTLDNCQMKPGLPRSQEDQSDA